MCTANPPPLEYIAIGPTHNGNYCVGYFRPGVRVFVPLRAYKLAIEAADVANNLNEQSEARTDQERFEHDNLVMAYGLIDESDYATD